MKVPARLLITVTAGTYLCVLCEVHTESYLSWMDLLFENIRTFADHNLSRFDLMHLIWFSFFQFSVLRDAMRVYAESASYPSMTLHRSGVRETVHAIMLRCSYSLMMSFGCTAVIILLVWMTFQPVRGPLNMKDLIVSSIYYLRSIELCLLICTAYCGRFLSFRSDGRNTCFCLITVILLIADLITKTGLITFTGSFSKEFMWLAVWSVILIAYTNVLVWYLKKRRDII